MGEDGTTFLVTEDSFLSGGSPLIGGPNTMTGYVTSYAPATGALVCQIGCTFQFEIRALQRGGGWGDGYSSTWEGGSFNDDRPIIKLSLGNGLMMVDTGCLTIRVPESQFRALRNRTYGASLTMTDSYDTRQWFIGRLPVFYGGVSL